MCHEQNGAAAVDDFVHLRKAFLLKLRVAHGQHFIDNEDLRIQVRGHRKCQSHIHATRVMFDGRFEKFLRSREINNLVKLRVDLAPAHAQDCSVQINILTASKIRMKAGANVEQASYFAVQFGAAGGGFDNAREYLKQRRFSGAVGPDDAHYLSRVDLEVDVLERPENLGDRMSVALYPRE